MSVGWDVKWCPVSRIKSPLARKKQFHWISNFFQFDIDYILQFLKKCDFYNIYIIFMSVGLGVQWCPCQGLELPWHAKDRFTGFRWNVGIWGPPGKHENFTNDRRLFIVAAVIRRNGVKYYIIHHVLANEHRPCSKGSTDLAPWW